jgi:hypothetical protein
MTDYDFTTLELIKEGRQGVVFKILSNIDGCTYIGKQLRELKSINKDSL